MKQFTFLMIASVLLGGLLMGCPVPPDDPPDTSGDEPPSHSALNPGGSNAPCESDADCTLEGESCFTAIQVCKESCESNLDCGIGAVCDPDAGLCVTCLSDEDCNIGVCDKDSRACVQCVESTDCLVGVCDPSVSYCVQCLENTDCLSGVCHGSKQTCVECLLESHCDDGDPCTEDACSEERCHHTPIPNVIGCHGVECLSDQDCPSTDTGCGVCTEQKCTLQWDATCSEDTECDDANACTEDTCATGQCGTSCVHVTTIPGCLPCGEAADCPTLPGTCQTRCAEGICGWTAIGEPGCECTTGADCNDGNPCTQEECVDGACEFTIATGTECASDDPCAIGAICDAGLCVALGISANCDIPCAVDAECPLNSIGCTGACQDGQCAYPPAAGKCPECDSSADCGDGNPCTDDVCILGICIVSMSPNGTGCDDGDPCTTSGTCASGSCVSLTPGTCPETCATDSDCATGNSQGGTLSDVSLSEPSSCGVGCIDGQCIYEQFEDQCAQGCKLDNACFSGAKCVTSGCGQLCQYEFNPDCVPCTEEDDCDDNDPCTQDKCGKGICEHQPLTGEICAEGTDCTLPSTCTEDGTCEPGEPLLKCNDDNPCTIDACDPGSGTCKFSPSVDGTLCDDGDNCTIDDICLLGSCTGEPKPNCGSDCPLGMGGECDPDLDSCENGFTCSCIPVGDSCAVHWCLPKTLTTPPVPCDGGACKGDDATCTCLNDPTQSPETCEYTTCLTPTICQECENDNDCQDAFPDSCGGQCDGGTCVPIPSSDQCVTSSDCPDGFSCGASACGKQCILIEAECVLEFGQEYPCDDQNDCTHDVCLSGKCQNSPLANNTECTFNKDEGTDEFAPGLCKNGTCVEQKTQPTPP